MNAFNKVGLSLQVMRVFSMTTYKRHSSLSNFLTQAKLVRFVMGRMVLCFILLVKISAHAV